MPLIPVCDECEKKHNVVPGRTPYINCEATINQRHYIFCSIGCLAKFAQKEAGV